MKMIKRVTVILMIILTINMIVSIIPSCIFLKSNEVYALETNNKSNIDAKSNGDYKVGNEQYSQSEVSIDDIDGSAKGEINDLYKYINKMKTDVELMGNLDPVEYIKTYIADGKGNLSFNTLLNGVLNIIFKEVKSVLKLIISIITISIICSLLKNLQDAFSDESISQVAFYACYALIIMLLSKSFIISISVAKEVITNISDFMSALLPILITMISLSGGITSAATLDPIVLGAVVFIPKVYSNIIIPMILRGLY